MRVLDVYVVLCNLYNQKIYKRIIDPACDPPLNTLAPHAILAPFPRHACDFLPALFPGAHDLLLKSRRSCPSTDPIMYKGNRLHSRIKDPRHPFPSLQSSTQEAALAVARPRHRQDEGPTTHRREAELYLARRRFHRRTCRRRAPRPRSLTPPPQRRAEKEKARQRRARPNRARPLYYPCPAPSPQSTADGLPRRPFRRLA